MAQLAQVIRNLRVNDFSELAKEITLEFSKEIIQALQSQLEQGISGDGKPTTLLRKGKAYDFYSPFTIGVKEEFGLGLGAVTDYVTLYMSGEFYNTMYLVVKDKTFEILSQVPYQEQILIRSGLRAMELTKENAQLIRDVYIKPELERRIKATLYAS